MTDQAVAELPKTRYAGLTPEQIEAKYKPTQEHTVEVQGNFINYKIYDFRETNNPASETTVHFDGFAQQPQITNLESALIEKARRHKECLIIPTIPILPPIRDAETPPNVKIDSSLDARLIWQGMKDLEFDLVEKPLIIAGWSDGGRTALEFADFVDRQKVKNPPSRKIVLFSLIGTVDIVDENRPACGLALAKAFADQTTDIIFEETRNRFNTEVRTKDEAGNLPMVRMGLDVMPGGLPKADILAEVAKLATTSTGREIFMRQFKIAWGKNIKLLGDVFSRGMSRGNSVMEKIGNFLGNLAKSETRSSACDRLSSFDVVLSIPSNDTIVSNSKIGRQIRKNAPDSFAGQNDEQLGLDFMNSKIDPQILFPRAKSVKLKVFGKPVVSPKPVSGESENLANRPKSLSVISTHVGPNTNPELYLTALVQN